LKLELARFNRFIRDSIDKLSTNFVVVVSLILIKIFGRKRLGPYIYKSKVYSFLLSKNAAKVVSLLGQGRGLLVFEVIKVNWLS
jgi:hypothetical protein